jgi:hypothetical protein
MLVLFVASCKKTENTKSPTTTANNKTYKSDPTGVSNVSGILVFTSMSTFQSNINNLISEQQAAVATFSAQFDSIASDSLVNAVAVSSGYNENQTYIDFENSLSFHSLRIDFDAMLTTWGTNGLNDADPNNPFIYYNAHSYALLTVLNSAGAVGIGTELYKIMRNGVVYEITDGSVTTLNKITDANMDKQYVASNVVTHNSSLIGTRTTNSLKKLSAGCYKDYNGESYINYAFYPAGGQHIQDAIETHQYYIYSEFETWAINWKNTSGSNYSRWYTNFSCGHKEDDNTCTTSTGASIGCIGTTSNSMGWRQHDSWVSTNVPGSSIVVQVPNYRTNTNLWHPNISPTTNHYETYLQ